MAYSKLFETRWSDFDANMHMRHTVYNDCAAQIRMNVLEEKGYGMHKLSKMGIGPILLKEETRYLKEVNMGENLTVDVQATGLSKNVGRWRMRHNIYKGEGVLAAIIEVEGAWIDLSKRKLTFPSDELSNFMLEMDRSEDFKWIEK